MESFEQGLKAKITRDLREGRVSTNLILLTIGAGGLRLTRNQLDVIFEWMVANPDEWRVHTYADEKIVVVFSRSPFHPEEWNNYEDYKRVMRQMFSDYGTEDFLGRRCSMEEAGIISRGLEELKNPIAVDDFVVFNYEGVETLGKVIAQTIYKPEFTVQVLSGVKRGFFYLCDGTELTAISPESAIKELIRQKKEWKENKQYSNE